MKTAKEKLTEIAEAILNACGFFQRGFPFAQIWEGKDLVVEQPGPNGEARYVGINDIFGNYFYIRVGAQIDAEPAKASADCASAIHERYACSLVAIVAGADPFILKDAILNILLKHGLKIGAQSMDAPAILKAELKGLDDAGADRAVARLKNNTLVKIDFELRRLFQTNSCEYSPCKSC